MKQIYSLALVLAVLAVVLGCSSSPQETGTTPVIKEPIIAPAAPEVPEITVDPVEEKKVEVKKKPEPCDLTIDPLTLDHITLSFEENGVKRTAEGIEFTFSPEDKAGKTIPVEGNLQVMLYWTEIFNGERRSKTIVYGANRYIKPSDAGLDCQPKTILLRFEDMLADSRFDVKEGDPGFIKVIFKRSGSDTEYAAEYMAKEGYGFFP